MSVSTSPPGGGIAFMPEGTIVMKRAGVEIITLSWRRGPWWSHKSQSQSVELLRKGLWITHASALSVRFKTFQNSPPSPWKKKNEPSVKFSSKRKFLTCPWVTRSLASCLKLQKGLSRISPHRSLFGYRSAYIRAEAAPMLRPHKRYRLAMPVFFSPRYTLFSCFHVFMFSVFRCVVGYWGATKTKRERARRDWLSENVYIKQYVATNGGGTMFLGMHFLLRRISEGSQKDLRKISEGRNFFFLEM